MKRFSILTLSLAAIASSVPRADAALVGLWRFENDFTDSSDQSNDGSNVGGVNFVASQAGFGQAGSFGGGSHVSVAHHPSLDMTTDMTIAAWVNHSATAWEAVLAKSPSAGSTANFPGNYELRVENNTNGLNFGYERTDGTGNPSLVFSQSAATVPASTWTHVAVTVSSGGTITHYINGVGVAGATAVFFGETNTNPLYIGSRADNFTFMDGLLDDVAIFDEVLDAGQIATISSGDFGAFIIPEPSAAALFGLASLGLFMRRRR